MSEVFPAIERVLDTYHKKIGIPTESLLNARAELAAARRLVEAAEDHFQCPTDDSEWKEFVAALDACQPSKEPRT